MRIDDVVHYVPIVGTSISHDGRYIVTATPMYSEERPLRPVRSRVMDLDASTPTWTLMNPGDGVESFYNPSISPDSKRLQAFRYSNAFLDIAIGTLDSPEDEPLELLGVPDEPAALKWRGIPGEPSCLGTDLDGTRRIWVWEDETKPPLPLTPIGRSVFDYAFSAETNQLAWIEQKRNDSPSALLHISDDRGEYGFSIPLPGTPVGYLSFAPDGLSLVFMGRPEGHRIARSEVWWVNWSSPENPQIECVTEDVEGWITSVEWNRFSNALLIAVDQGTSGRILHRPLNGKEPSWIEEAGRYLSGPILDKTRGQMLYLRQGSDLPQQLCLKSGKSKKPRVLTRFNRRMEQRRRFNSTPLSWIGADGLHVEGLWMQPDGDGPFPTLVWLHGGPAEHINCTFSPYFQTFLTAGYAIFAPNYRGSTGRGSDFLKANIGDLCGKDVEDILHGLTHLEEHFPIQKDQVFAMGWSYGGSLALMASRSERFKRIVVVAPVVDWVAIFGAQRYPAITREYFEMDVWEDRKPFDSRSPISFASEMKTPTLFLHGSLDPLVPPSQSALMERALRGQGVETKFHLVPSEFHVFRRPASILWMLSTVHEWLESEGNNS